MAPIRTYVFLDLETTGLPREELNKTKIIELSMVIVKRRHILETLAGHLPRVQHKLTMCFNPGRMIYPGASQASGLDNDLLEYETCFNIEVFNTIKSLLACQEKPLCLVAENGHAFDFPILKNHFQKLNESLDEDVMCADSLHAFYDILNGAPCSSPEQSDGSSTNGKLNVNKTENKKDELDCSLKDNISGILTASESVVKDDADALSMKSQNERTPKSNTFKVTPKKLRDVRRKLFYVNNKKPDQLYKLKNIYERILKQPGKDAHRAESDCIMTAEIATAKAEEFVEWIDNNHCPFSEVKAMTLAVPVGH
ncbi:unnamed protein product [Arctia plantaginis]|uniref:Exonuclease domain-containing protein n=1 Tax=Arctia plantaginis TaxID=874455 RepID=A0A8S1AIW7_ARCPL|nr:unnamed protein product [Arctia plantaginis]